MATTFLLLRHASHDLLGRVLAGRAPGVWLNDRGRAEAARLGEELARQPVHALYASPMERTQETARFLAERLGLELRLDDAFHEIDFREWTARSFDELAPWPEWQLWNRARHAAQPPGGETMAGAQARFVRGLERLAKQHAGECVAIVSHGDVIKAALMHYLEIPLSLIMRLEVEPASVSCLVHGPEHVQVPFINRSIGSMGRD
jgi:probable phosphoglycerate mutase